jgi:hypothetical protein
MSHPDNNDGNKSVWVTEWTVKTHGSGVPASKIATKQQQADLLKIGYEEFPKYSWGDKLLWYTYKDERPESENAYYLAYGGLKNYDFSPKPSWDEMLRQARYR